MDKLNNKMSYFKSSVKLPTPVILWIFVFIGFHLARQDDLWKSIENSAWPLVSYMGAVAVVWVSYFGWFKKPVENKSIVLTLLFSFGLLFALSGIPYYEYTGFNAHFWRLITIVFALIVGIVVWVRNRVPVLNKMMMVGAIGILFLQCLHSWIFFMSYDARQDLLITEYKWIVTTPNHEDIQTECKNRKYDCYYFRPEADLSGVKFQVTDFNRGTVEYAQSFVSSALRSKKEGFQVWSWINDWARVPNRNWPAVIVVRTDSNGGHWLLVDGDGMTPIIKSHTSFFALLAGLGTLSWGIGALLLVFYHKYAWKKKAKLKMVGANAKNS